MPATLHIKKPKDHYVLFWRQHDSLGETEYGNICRLSTEEAAALVASKLVDAWFDVGNQPIPGLDEADPARFILMEEDDGGWPQIRIVLPPNPTRDRAMEILYDDGYLPFLGNPDNCAALLTRTRIADRRRQTAPAP
jgi:hypothetical protein